MPMDLRQLSDNLAAVRAAAKAMADEAARMIVADEQMRDDMDAVRDATAARTQRGRDRQERRQAAKVVGAGFEPAKAEPTGLQPVPFDRSGTPPGRPEV